MLVRTVSSVISTRCFIEHNTIPVPNVVDETVKAVDVHSFLRIRVIGLTHNQRLWLIPCLIFLWVEVIPQKLDHFILSSVVITLMIIVV